MTFCRYALESEQKEIVRIYTNTTDGYNAWFEFAQLVAFALMHLEDINDRCIKPPTSAKRNRADFHAFLSETIEQIVSCTKIDPKGRITHSEPVPSLKSEGYVNLNYMPNGASDYFSFKSDHDDGYSYFVGFVRILASAIFKDRLKMCYTPNDQLPGMYFCDFLRKWVPYMTEQWRRSKAEKQKPKELRYVLDKDKKYQIEFDLKHYFGGKEPRIICPKCGTFKSALNEEWMEKQYLMNWPPSPVYWYRCPRCGYETPPAKTPMDAYVEAKREESRRRQK